MFEKLKVEKVEMVKRVIRQNNYHQYEKSFQQCSELGLNINRQALDRFANKLELIDKAQLSKRQYELHKIELAQQEQREKRQQEDLLKRSQQVNQQRNSTRDQQLDSHLDALEHAQTRRAPHSAESKPRADKSKPAKVMRNAGVGQSQKMSYEQVKQRENEITFELGELKIRENELLQELINLSQALDTQQKN